MTNIISNPAEKIVELSRTLPLNTELLESLQNLGAFAPLSEPFYFQRTPEVTFFTKLYMEYCLQKTGFLEAVRENLSRSNSVLDEFRKEKKGASIASTPDKRQSPKEAQVSKQKKIKTPLEKSVVEYKSLSHDEKKAQRSARKAMKDRQKKERIEQSRAKKQVDQELPCESLNQESQQVRISEANQPCLMLTLIEYEKHQGQKIRECFISISGHEEKQPNPDGTWANERHKYISSNWNLLYDLTLEFNEKYSKELQCEFYFLNHHSKNIDDLLKQVSETFDVEKAINFHKKCAEGKTIHTLLKMFEKYGPKLQILGAMPISFFPTEKELTEDEYISVEDQKFEVKLTCTDCYRKKEIIFKTLLAVIDTHQQEPKTPTSSPKKDSLFSPFKPHFTKRGGAEEVDQGSMLEPRRLFP